jgi:hypothetical protein
MILINIHCVVALFASAWVVLRVAAADRAGARSRAYAAGCTDSGLWRAVVAPAGGARGLGDWAVVLESEARVAWDRAGVGGGVVDTVEGCEGGEKGPVGAVDAGRDLQAAGQAFKGGMCLSVRRRH